MHSAGRRPVWPSSITWFEGMIHGAFRMPAALEGVRDMVATSAAVLGRAFNLSR
jgi:hypothetical protein